MPVIPLDSGIGQGILCLACFSDLCCQPMAHLGLEGWKVGQLSVVSKRPKEGLSSTLGSLSPARGLGLIHTAEDSQRPREAAGLLVLSLRVPWSLTVPSVKAAPRPSPGGEGWGSRPYRLMTVELVFAGISQKHS